MPTKLSTIEIDMSQLEDALRRAEKKLDEKDYAILRAVVDAYDTITELVDDKNTTIARLRKLLFGSRTEKTKTVIGVCGRFDCCGGGAGKRRENASPRTRPQRGRRLRRGGEGCGASRVAPAGRSLPEVRQGHGLRDGSARRAGAAGRAGPDSGQDLRTAEVAVQPVRRRLHGPVARRRWGGEV